MDPTSDSQCTSDCETLKNHAQIVSDPDRHAKAQAKMQQDQVLHQKAISMGAKHLKGKVKKGLAKAFPKAGETGDTPFEKAGKEGQPPPKEDY